MDVSWYHKLIPYFNRNSVSFTISTKIKEDEYDPKTWVVCMRSDNKITRLFLCVRIKKTVFPH
jgi:hypothetical protein